MKLVKKVITDKMGFSTELYDMITDNGKVENLTLNELEFIHSSLKTIHEEVQFDSKDSYFSFRKTVNTAWQRWKDYLATTHNEDIKSIQESVTLEYLYKDSRGNAEKAAAKIDYSIEAGSPRLITIKKKKEAKS